MSSEKEWIRLGKTDFRISYLRSVTEKEAIEFLKGDHIHTDRVRNAWKQANKKK